MDLDDQSYSVVLEQLKDVSKSSRDPRALRLASVTSALVEMIQNSKEGGSEVTAAKVYAKAVTALEGTLKNEDKPITETFSTQTALLEVLDRTLPHVTPPAIITATLPLTSRILRAIIASSQSVEEGGNISILETKDELGGINTVLRGTCRTTSQLLKRLDEKADHKAVKQIILETLLSLFHDSRHKVRKSAHAGVMELLLMENPPCHGAIQKTVAQYAHSELVLTKRQIKDTSQSTTHSSDDVLNLLSFLEHAVMKLDFPKLGDDMMELLAYLLQIEETSVATDFVAISKVKNEAPKILTISALLTAVAAMMKTSVVKPDQEEKLNLFASRVLASLLASSPSVVFRTGTAEYDVLQMGRTVYGQAVLAACNRVASSNPDLGCRLLPLSIQMIVLLSKPIQETLENSSVAETIMVELTQSFRDLVPTLLESKSQNINNCLTSSLAAMAKVLDPFYRPTWSVSLMAFVALLQAVQSESNVASYVKSLLVLRNQVPPGSPSQYAVEGAFSTLVQGLGIEMCWKWLDFSPSSVESNNAGVKLEQVWIIAAVKAAMQVVQPQPPRMAFFQNEILALARACDKLAASSKEKHNFHRERVVDLWSLLPCFCLAPSDSSSALPSMTTTLCRAIEDKRYPQLVGIICTSLKNLCNSTQERGESAAEDRDALREASVKLLPILFKLVTSNTSSKPQKDGSSDAMDVEAAQDKKDESQEHAQKLQSLVQGISSLAAFAPQQFLVNLFKKLMNRLLEEAQAEIPDSERICSLLTLSQALVTAKVLDETNISFLYRALKPLMRNDENDGRVQKRAYKVLAEICEHYHTFATEKERLREILHLLTHTMMSSQVSARHMRLKCMCAVVDGLEDNCREETDEFFKASAEIILCLKDANGKTREAAHQLVKSLAAKDLMGFLNIVAAALGAETSHMRSAALVALSRVIYEFASENDALYSNLPSLLKTVLVLMDENAREVVKSVLGFVRISVAHIPSEQLEPLLPELVKSLMQFNKVKSRFRQKIKIILKKLVKRFGYEKLMPFVPESETRLLTHMRKLDERVKRRKMESKANVKPVGDEFDHMFESDEEDSDEGRTLVTGATGLTRATRKSAAASRRSAAKDGTIASNKSNRTMKGQAGVSLRLSNEVDGEVVDILGSSVARRVKFAEDQVEDSDSDDDMIEFDDSGRLVVHDIDRVKERNEEDEEDFIPAQAKRRRLGKGEERSRASAKSKGSQVSGKSKGSQSRKKELGAAYKSKKAGGDVKKKGQKYEPYAYVPLDGRMYTKKNRRSAVEQMSTVVRQGGKNRQVGKRKSR